MNSQGILLIKLAIPFMIAGTLLWGCGAPDFSEQIAKDRLEQAQTAFAQAKANPNVELYAYKTLLEAEKTLKNAESVNTKVYSPNPADPSKGYDVREKKLFFQDVARLSYMTERKAQTSVALAEGAVTRNEVAKLAREKAELALRKSRIEQKLLQQDLDEKATALKLAREQLSTAASEVERARILGDIQAKEAALAKAQADAKAREAEKAREELAQLMKELSQLQGQLTERGIVLTIGDVLFATGKSDLNTSAQISMDKIAVFLQEKQNRNLLVEGHTDNVGSEAYNQGLSEQRADAVRNALVKRGIAIDRIVTVGYGKRYPVAGNDTVLGRQQNRRVEVIILNEGVKPESQFRN